jgi:hypothetical protein
VQDSKYAASKNVKGFVDDFGENIRSRFSLINGRLEDNRTNMNVGIPNVYIGAWNTIAGLRDAFSTTITDNTM